MSDKIKTCKPSLINHRTSFNYKFEFVDKEGAEWKFDLHEMSARQRGAVQASYAVVRIGSDGAPQTEIENNLELVNTVIIHNALSGWNLDEPITVDNIDLLPQDVRNALVAAINSHESENEASLEADIKN